MGSPYALGSADLRGRVQVFVCVCVWSGRHGGRSGEASVGLRVCSVARQQRSGVSWWALFILSLWRVTCLPWGVGGGARWVWINCASRVVQEWDKSSRFVQLFSMSAPCVQPLVGQGQVKGWRRAGQSCSKRGPTAGRAKMVAAPLMCLRECPEWATVWSRVGHKRVTTDPPGPPGHPLQPIRRLGTLSQPPLWPPPPF